MDRPIPSPADVVEHGLPEWLDHVYLPVADAEAVLARFFAGETSWNNTWEEIATLVVDTPPQGAPLIDPHDGTDPPTP